MKAMEGSHFRPCDVTQPNQICINRINSILLLIITWFAFLLIFLLKVVDFGEKICIHVVCNEIGYFIGYSSLQEVNLIFKMVASIGSFEVRILIFILL